jgi:hypothetical protein
VAEAAVIGSPFKPLLQERQMSVLQKVLEFFHLHPHATIKQDDPARPNDFTLHETPEAPAVADVVIPREHVQILRMEGVVQQHPYHREAYKPVHNVARDYHARVVAASQKSAATRRDDDDSSSHLGSTILAGAAGLGVGLAISSMMDSDHSQSPVSDHSQSPVSDDNSFSGGNGGSFDGGGSSSSDYSSSSSSSDYDSSSYSSGSDYDSSSSSSSDW